MIYVKYDTNLFEYEIADIIKLFFKEEQICRLTDEEAVKEILREFASGTGAGAYQNESKEDIGYGEVFLRTWIEENEGCPLFMLSFKGKDFDTAIKLPTDLNHEKYSSDIEYTNETEDSDVAEYFNQTEDTNQIGYTNDKEETNQATYSKTNQAAYSNREEVPIRKEDSNGNIPDGSLLHETSKQKKNYLKKELYKALSKISGKESPWGILTGVRPSKIVHEMLENGYVESVVTEKLRGNYLVSAKKARLLYEVAKTEKRILDTASPETISLYIGIPFCTTRCLYCSFTSNSIDKCRHLIDGYLSALAEEMKGIKEIIENNSLKLQSIYIGGGTPTSIDCGQLERLLELTAGSFHTEDVEEYTLEAGRPDTINKEKLKIIKDSKVTRISINPQSMNDETLLAIGRNHTARDIIEAFALARETGFDNINMDIITGLPGENLQMFEYTLKEINKLSPDAITVHAIAVKRASRFKEEREKYKMISDQEASDMMDMAHMYAKDLGMHPYYLYRQKNILGNLENVGYSKPGYESIYNVQIMGEKQTIIALGAGGVTKVVYPQENRIERAFNVKNVEEYIKRIPEMLERKKKLLCTNGQKQ